ESVTLEDVGWRWKTLEKCCVISRRWAGLHAGGQQWMGHNSWHAIFESYHLTFTMWEGCGRRIGRNAKNENAERPAKTIMRREHLETMRKAHPIETTKTHDAKVTKKSIEKDAKKVCAKSASCSAVSPPKTLRT